MKLSAHFTLEEMTKSAVAFRLRLDNRPPAAVIDNLERVARGVLEPVRAEFGIPFSPSSGYRSLALNRALGSGDNSQHIKGEAVDFELPGVANLTLARWISANLVFDQLILEGWRRDDPGAGWVHASLKARGNRGEVLTIDRTGVRRGLPNEVAA